MSNKFQTAQLFKEVFNIRNISYPDVGSDRDQEANIKYGNVSVSDETEVDQEQSYLGTPVLFPITFKGGRYKKYRNGQVEVVSIGEFRLPNPTVASFTRKKTKTKTPVSGGMGTVKEIYAHEDWSIKLQGFCLDDPAHPQAKTFSEQVDRLLEFEELTDSIEVSGQLFRQKNIYRLDIDKIDLPATTGKPRMQAFTIACESDEPIELIL